LGCNYLNNYSIPITRIFRIGNYTQVLHNNGGVIYFIDSITANTRLWFINTIWNINRWQVVRTDWIRRRRGIIKLLMIIHLIYVRRILLSFNGTSIKTVYYAIVIRSLSHKPCPMRKQKYKNVRLLSMIIVKLIPSSSVVQCWTSWIHV
jgi:hypothetical protein